MMLTNEKSYAKSAAELCLHCKTTELSNSTASKQHQLECNQCIKAKKNSVVVANVTHRPQRPQKQVCTACQRPSHKDTL